MLMHMDVYVSVYKSVIHADVLWRASFCKASKEAPSIFTVTHDTHA